MATAKQIELFRKLTEDRDFGPTANAQQLRDQFATLTDRNASAWIERALDLPKKGDAGEEGSHVPAPF